MAATASIGCFWDPHSLARPLFLLRGGPSSACHPERGIRSERPRTKRPLLIALQYEFIFYLCCKRYLCPQSRSGFQFPRTTMSSRRCVFSYYDFTVLVPD